MNRSHRAACLLAICLAGVRLRAQNLPPGIPVQAVVSVEAKRGDKSAVPELRAKDVTVTTGKERLQVLDLVPATGDQGRLRLYLVLDDSSQADLGSQFGDLKKFVNELPKTALVAIGYMRNGSVLPVQEWTTDHASAAGKLRLPLGSPGASASPWFALSELAKNWPRGEERSEVLMISDGIDRYYGGGPDNPYVNAAIEDAMRSGIVVNSIYWGGAGHASHSLYLTNWGQSYLSEIADATGGEQYYRGFNNPVSFAPFLDDLARRLERQFILTFQARPRPKAGTERIRISAELPDAELVGPRQVWVPAS